MKKLFATILFALLFFSLTPKAFAEKIHSFDVNITAHKDGTMDFSEKIDYDFGELSRHGIYRYIPLFAKVGDPPATTGTGGQVLYRVYKVYSVKVLRDGKSEQYSESTDAKQLNLKIGNPDHTITGAHDYEIEYTVSNGIASNYTDHDEIYWNATGNGWDVDINSATITFNTDFNASPTKVLCFTGAYGAKDSNCEVSSNSAKTTQILYSAEGLSAVAVYPLGTFPKSFLSKSPPQTFGEKAGNWLASHYGQIWQFLNVILPIILLVWYQVHKNKKRFGNPAVSFEIPKDGGERIAPALAGTIDTAKLNKDDVTATIFDLAIRKYIKLVGTKKVRSFAPDTTDIKIVKLKESSGLNTYETTLYDRLFEKGNEVDVKDLAVDFYSTYVILEDQVFRTLKEKKYFVRNPKAEKILLIFLGVISLVMFNLFLSITLFYLSRKLIGRTVKGDEMDFQIDGLKLFLQKMDRNYNWQAQKFYTVEQMIPYALALGFIDKFMEQLKILKPDYNPTWYTGYSGSFYANYALFSAGISSNLTTASPSSSGSSGGGFSGGGGGGGGGGSW